MLHAAVVLVKTTAKVILLTAEILDYANLFWCLKINVKHIDIPFSKQFLKGTELYLVHPVKKPVAF